MKIRSARVLAVFLVALAGCSGSVVPNSPTTTQTTETPSSTPPSPSTTAKPAECGVTYEPTNSNLPSSEAKELPDKPASLNASAVKSLVAEVEYAVTYNAEYEPRYDQISISVDDVTVEETATGYNATVGHVKINTRTGKTAGSDAWAAHYVVNESHLARATNNQGGQRSPTLTTIHCWNSSA